MYKSPITIEALLVLDAIDSRGSFAAAAEQLNKVPSALSYIVQRLEEQLSVTLFVRQGRRSVLTPAGRHLLEEGRKLLGAVSVITEQTQTIAHGWEPKLRIAIDSILDANEILPCIGQFLEEHPNIEVDLSEEVMNGTWEALNEDRVDLLIGAPSPIPNHKGIGSRLLRRIEHVFVVSQGHELTQFEQPIARADIQDYRTVVVHDTAKHDIPWSSNIIEQSRHCFVPTITNKIAAITAGIGVGFLPLHRIETQLAQGSLVRLAVNDGDVHSDVYLAWKVVNKGKGLKRLREIMTARFNL